jgi:hypothetical protein
VFVVSQIKKINCRHGVTPQPIQIKVEIVKIDIQVGEQEHYYPKG